MPERIPPDPVDFHSPRSFDFLAFLFGGALTLFSVFAAIRGPSGGDGLEMWFGRVLFGAIAIWGGTVSLRWLGRLRQAQPRLSLDHSGIVDRTSLGSPVRVDWDDMVSLDSISGDTLEIRVQDPGELGLSIPRRLLGRFLRRDRRTHLVIPVRALDAPATEIIRIAEEHHRIRLLGEGGEGRRPGGGEGSSPTLPSP